MSERITISAGQRGCILRRAFSSIPATYRFDAACTAPGAEPTGTVEVRGSTWIAPKAPVTFPLQAANTVSKGYWDTFFAVYVTPDVDVTVTLPGARHPALTWLLLLVLLVALLAVTLALLLAR